MFPDRLKYGFFAVLLGQKCSFSVATPKTFTQQFPMPDIVFLITYPKHLLARLRRTGLLPHHASNRGEVAAIFAFLVTTTAMAPLQCGGFRLACASWARLGQVDLI